MGQQRAAAKPAADELLPAVAPSRPVFACLAPRSPGEVTHYPVRRVYAEEARVA